MRDWCGAFEAGENGKAATPKAFNRKGREGRKEEQKITFEGLVRRI
jgi:hypothetical protein